MFNHLNPNPHIVQALGRNGQTFCFLSSSLHCLHIIIPAPSFKNFWHCHHSYIFIDFLEKSCFTVFIIPYIPILLTLCMCVYAAIRNVINLLFTFRMGVYAASYVKVRCGMLVTFCGTLHTQLSTLFSLLPMFSCCCL